MIKYALLSGFKGVVAVTFHLIRSTWINQEDWNIESWQHILLRLNSIERLEKTIKKEQENFKSNHEAQLAALDEESVTRRIQNDQDGIRTAAEKEYQDELAALLARYNQELATLQRETSNKIKHAIAEAKNAKESLKSGLQEEEAKVERKFQLWKEELKKKRKEETDKVAYEAFKVVQEQAGSTIEVDISSSLATPSRPVASVAIQPPIPSPITPREASPKNNATITPQSSRFVSLQTPSRPALQSLQRAPPEATTWSLVRFRHTNRQ
jgi:hypothetical protein